MRTPSASSHVRSALGRLATAGLALFCVLAPSLPAPGAAPQELAALVSQMPDADRDGKYTGPDPAVAEKIYLEILKGGKESIAALVGLLVEPGKGEDYKARYVLHGLATYAARPGAENDRRMMCEALVSTLADPTPKAVRAYVIQSLEAIGSKEMTGGALGKLILDEELYDPAIRALVAYGDTADILRQALGAAKGRNRVAVIQALGVLRDSRSVADLKAAASDADADVRIAARDALGSIGDTGAVETLLAAGQAAKGHERTKATEAALVLAKRLFEAGNKKDAERVYRVLWDSRTSADERQVRIAALEGLAAVRGDMNDLLAAMKTGDPQIRAASARLAMTMPGQEVTMKCVAALEKAPPTDRAGLLDILGARRDPAAMQAVLKMFKDADEMVRAAAMEAAASIGAEGAAEALVAVVTDRNSKDLSAAVDALAKMQGKEAGAAIATTIKQATDPWARCGLLAVLAARRMADQMEVVTAAVTDQDAAVRLAAVRALGPLASDAQLPLLVKVLKETGNADELAAAQEALIAACGRRMGDACANLVAPAIEGAAPKNAVAMVRVLTAAGSRKAADAVAAAAKNQNPDVKDAAVRALADWKSSDAVPALVEITQASDNPTHKVLALRGVLRLASAKGLDAGEKSKMLAQTMKAAKRPEDKREVLAVLGGTPTLAALETAAACLDEDPVKEEAAAAVVQIAEKVARQNPDAVRDAVGKARAAAKSDAVRAAAQRILNQVGKP